MRRWFVLSLILATLATVGIVQAPKAAAAVSLCNNTSSLGAFLWQVTPPDGIRRNLYGKVCVVYDLDSVRNSSVFHCRWASAPGTGCDFRVEVLQAKLDKYNSAGGYVGTLSNQWFRDSGSNYKPDWSFLGADNVQPGLCPDNHQYQANDFSIRWRLKVDGVLRGPTDEFSQKGDLTC